MFAQLQKSEIRSQESGIRNQESGGRRQEAGGSEAGIRRQYPLGGEKIEVRSAL